MLLFIALSPKCVVETVNEIKILRNLHFDRNQLLLINQVLKSLSLTANYLTTTPN